MTDESLSTRHPLNRSLARACTPDRQPLNKTACVFIILRHIVMRHNLRIALIQVEQLVDFLLLNAKPTHAFFMLEGVVKLLPEVSKRLFHAFAFGFLFFCIAVKAAERTRRKY